MVAGPGFSCFRFPFVRVSATAFNLRERAPIALSGLTGPGCGAGELTNLLAGYLWRGQSVRFNGHIRIFAYIADINGVVMDREIERFLKTGGFAVSTQRAYRWVLNRVMLDGIDLAGLDDLGLVEWLESHETWGNSMQAQACEAVQSFVRFRYGDQHPVLNLHCKRLESAPGRSLTVDQVEALYGIFTIKGNGKRVLKAARDLAMVSVLLDTGLRSSEICRLECRHVFLSDHGFPYLAVRAKGGGWDEKPFSVYTALDLGTWLNAREKIVASGAKSCFLGVMGNTPGQPMTTGGLRAVGGARGAG